LAAEKYRMSPINRSKKCTKTFFSKCLGDIVISISDSEPQNLSSPLEYDFWPIGHSGKLGGLPVLRRSLKMPRHFVDRFARSIEYLRLAVTDRCNLRCVYCLPDKNNCFLPKSQLLSDDEIDFLADVFISMGVRKIRLTGGEPLLREGICEIVKNLKAKTGLKEIHITSNGVCTETLERLCRIGLSGINLSLDTLREERFQKISQYDALKKVLISLETVLGYGIPLKINANVQEGVNDDEIFELSQLARNFPIEVRFIEQMPFNGARTRFFSSLTATRIQEQLLEYYPEMVRVPASKSTAQVFMAPGLLGRIGIIAGHSRSFCDKCNRIRVTADGRLKNCLYSTDDVMLRDIIRQEKDLEEVSKVIQGAIWRRPEDGKIAQANWKTSGLSMAQIGG
jgi:cyclic pyranopterin phosphate synthase